MTVLTTRRPLRCKSVGEHWIAWLPEEKRCVFDAVAGELKTSYNMLSVALDEALSLRTVGALAQARQEALMSAELFDRLDTNLLGVLRALRDQAHKMASLPAVLPLSPENFRNEIGRRAAMTNGMYSLVLFSNRSRFLYKVDALEEVSQKLAREFRMSAQKLTEGSSAAPAIDWDILDTLHYDINTCLRDSIVVLKSFLLLLPEDHLRSFNQKLTGPCTTPRAPRRVRFESIRRRLMSRK